jgi:hypothetical protein
MDFALEVVCLSCQWNVQEATEMWNPGRENRILEGFRVGQSWVQIPIPPITSSVNVGRMLDFIL